MSKKMPSSNTQSMMSKDISDGIKSILGKNVRILFKSAVKLEIKGDKMENRILVFCPCRLFCVKIPNPRIDFHFHYLEIQGLESKKPNQLVLIVNEKSYSFIMPENEKHEVIDNMIYTLLNALREAFPGTHLLSLIRRVDVLPWSRVESYELGSEGCSSSSTTTTPLLCPKSKSSSSLSCGGEESGGGDRSSSISVSSGSGGSGGVVREYEHVTVSYGGPGGTSTSPCGGFSTQYAWMCDLYGLPYREEVAWDVDTIYLSHDSRELCLHDFDHLEPRDSVPILSALEYNTWFKSLRLNNVKLSNEGYERLIGVIRKSVTIEELHLDGIGVKVDFVLKLSNALGANPNSQVHTIDLSHNMIEDKGAVHLSNSIAKLCRGPIWLNLSGCGLSAKGVAQLAHALALNRSASNSLTHLNLSGNSLKDDINNLCNFLAQPNSITFLDLSSTDCSLETVFGALLRGSTSHLSHLNLSKNNFGTKKGKEIPPSFKQFLTSSLALKYLSLSSCKLSLEALKQLLLGLACNESAAEVELDVSQNALGSQGANVLESCLPIIKCLSSLDISENNLEAELGVVVAAASKNKSIKSLNLSKNLLSTKPKHLTQVMEAIVQVLQDEDCVLQSLFLADSKLKAELYSVINALGSNQCLQNINISGNLMGDVGARLLAKALQINSKLRSITYDRNNITIQGFSDIAYGLESNTSVRFMPFPVHDSLACMKVSAEKTEAVMKKIQDLVFRNSQPKKATNGHQAFRLQQGFLLSSSQQTVDKLISQNLETLKVLKKNELNSSDNSQGHALTHAETLIKDSERAKQLLLSLHDIIEERGESGKVLETKLQSIADDLYSVLSQHVSSNVEHVLEVAEEKCPTLLGADLKKELKGECSEKSKICSEFIRHCVMDLAGTDIVNKINEIQLSLASHISEKLVDSAMDSLIRCQKQLNDLKSKRSSTPDVLKTRARTSPSELSKETCDSVFGESNANYSDHSPMKLEYLNLATPQLHGKRKGLHGRRIRPNSVVDCVEGISADDIPDLLPTLPRTIEETISNLVDLPPISPAQLKHLGKARPKKPKTRAPTRPSVRSSDAIEEVSSLQEGLDTFFRPGSTTPTPILTPDSEECSTSLMLSSLTSALGESPSLVSTPTHSSRTFLVGGVGDGEGGEGTSPSSFETESSASLTVPPRSKSTDCVEKEESGGGERRSPGPPKIGVSIGPTLLLAEMKARQEKRSSTLLFPSSPSPPGGESGTSLGSLSVSEAKEKFGGGSKRPPPVAPKPRPWSVVGPDRRSGEYSLGSEGSSPNTPDSGEVLEDGNNKSGDNIIVGESMSLPPVVSSISSSSSKFLSSMLGGTKGSSGSSTELVSLPPPKSVKEMAASLMPKQQSSEELSGKKKSESLPRNATPPSSGETVPQESSDLVNKAISTRVGLNEWNRSQSMATTSTTSGDLWKFPLKKISFDGSVGSNSRPLSKRWELNQKDEGNKGSSEFLNSVSRLRKVSNEEEIVNV